MLSPCLSLGLDLQCFTRDGTKIHKYTLSEISCATHDFLRSHGSFFMCQGSNHIRPISVFSLLKNFQNSSFNEPDSPCYSILSPSMPIDAISDLSELVIFNILCESNY